MATAITDSGLWRLAVDLVELGKEEGDEVRGLRLGGVAGASRVFSRSRPRGRDLSDFVPRRPMPNRAAHRAAVDLFVESVGAISRGELIRRANRRDKEFHFQDWVSLRMQALGLHFDGEGRNSYPDLVLTRVPVGFEVKGLGWPGREANYDCNSQVPTGYHNGRDIYYVFGRYPAQPDDDEYPVVDLVICHGDFLNADHNYVHQNKSIRAFGSYGDILLRDRKMYVAPTPFALVQGSVGQKTLIMPTDADVDDRLRKVGDLTRREAAEVMVGYHFNLETNELSCDMRANPNAGTPHLFAAYRVAGDQGPVAQMVV